MTFLCWEEPLSALANKLTAGSVRIVLSACELRAPSAAGVAGSSIPCSAIVILDSHVGFELEIQGPIPLNQSPRVIAAALQVESQGAYCFRGTDSEGGTWFARDPRPQVSVDLVAGVFVAKMSPYWISVRSPLRSNQPHTATEIAINAEVRLPPITYSHVDDTYSANELNADAGTLRSTELELTHNVAGLYRIISVTGDSCSSKRSIRNLMDAIAFVCGQRVEPEITRVSTQSGTSLHIHRRRVLEKVRMPPIRWQGTIGIVRAWKALRLFWCFAESHPGDLRPKVSQVIAELHSAQAPAYISVMALIAAVAVETLVNHYITGQGARSREEVEEFKSIIRQSELPADAKEQCLNAVGYMTRANASRRLRALADAGVVPSDIARRWIQGRPRLAHGVPRNSTEDADTFLASQTLCHAVILGLIGYEDEFEARRNGRTDTLLSRRVPQHLLESIVST